MMWLGYSLDDRFDRLTVDAINSKLMINLKTTKPLGLEAPQTLLVTPGEVDRSGRPRLLLAQSGHDDHGGERPLSGE